MCAPLSMSATSDSDNNNDDSSFLSSEFLRVLEGYTRDISRAIARIDYATMDTVGVSTGNVIEIRPVAEESGSQSSMQNKRRKTVAKVLPLYPTDEGKGIIRIDGLIRNNAGLSIGNAVTIRKAKTAPAERVLLAPLEALPPIKESYISDALQDIPITIGDKVMIPYFGGTLTFKVLGIAPYNQVHGSSRGDDYFVGNKSENESKNLVAVLVSQNTRFILTTTDPTTTPPISITINEYIRQEAEIEREFTTTTGAIENDQRSKSFFLGFRMELICTKIVERIDYQTKLSKEEVENVSSLIKRYIDIAHSEVKAVNDKITKEIMQTKNFPIPVPQEYKICIKISEALGDENKVRDMLRDLKFAIVKKWASAKFAG